MKQWAGLDGFFCGALLTLFLGPSVRLSPPSLRGLPGSVSSD